eukprot:jgi/Phyca11/115700/e_gw1.29.444.1
MPSSLRKMHATVTHFYPSLTLEDIKAKKRQIYNCIKQRDLIINKCETGCASHCKDLLQGMGTTLPPAFEEQLVCWLNSLRKEGVPVAGTMVRIHAKDCYDSTNS